MTIIYDSKDHVRVIFSLKGTVWGSVFPLCVMNLMITLAVYLLKEYDVIDMTFDDDGHRILATMVAFLVVSRVTAAYTRFWEARTLLSKCLQECRQCSISAAAFSKSNDADRAPGSKAEKWRHLLCKRLCKLLHASIDVLKNPDRTVQLLHDSSVVQTTITSKTMKKILSRQDSTLRWGSEENPMELAAYVHAAITMQDKYLTEALIIHKELKLHQHVTDFTAYYHELAKFSATPYPFPTAQMTRIFLFVWMFSLPFALVHQANEPYSILLVIFFITYGFFGLEFVSIELDDPFGDDPNDLEMDNLSEVVMKGVKLDLGWVDGETGVMSSPLNNKANADASTATTSMMDHAAAQSSFAAAGIPMPVNLSRGGRGESNGGIIG